jgi:hypothetical protein
MPLCWAMAMPAPAIATMASPSSVFLIMAFLPAYRGNLAAGFHREKRC